jgi:hypothetical protein
MDIERWTYREVGVHNGPTIVPTELEAGLIERATPALAYRVALGYAKAHMRYCEEDMQADHRCPPSRSTLERMAKTIGTEAKRVSPRIEPRVRHSEKVPEGAVAISAGLDRTSVPMEEELPPGEEPNSRRKKRKKKYERKRPPRVNVNYRMAYVGTISIHDADGEDLVTLRYAIGAHERPEHVVSRLMADLRNALRQAPDLAVGIVQDGAPELWNLLRNALVNEPLVSKWYEAIDRYHLNERLGEVLRFTEANAAERKQRMSRWNESLDQNENAIYRIREWVRERYSEAVDADDTNLIEQLAPHVTYLENNVYLMRYARLRMLGLPVGSGVTEGACNSLVEMRANGSGQRWRPDGLEAVLTLRSIYMSDRLPRFWANFSQDYRAEVRKCA